MKHTEDPEEQRVLSEVKEESEELSEVKEEHHLQRVELSRPPYVKPWLYFRLSPQRKSPQTARAPPQTGEAFILDALAVVLFCETIGDDSSNCPLNHQESAISSSHTNCIISEAPSTSVTWSVKVLPLEFSNKCCKLPSATSEDEHQSIRKS
ncbi:unnamed protein product [Leuciscus chuanchicus]